MTVQVDNSVYTPDNIRKIIAENQKGDYDDRTGPTIGFIPEGRHVIRWFFDPTGKLFREVMIGRVGKKRFVCPDFLARTDKITSYPFCEIDRIAKERDLWRDKCRYHCMVYGVLYETKNATEYWKLDNGQPTTFVIIGNSYLKRALLEMLENLQDNGMDMLLAMLTPNVRGFFSSVNVTKGQQGNIAIQVLTKSVDPVVLGDWYVPLSEVYIQNEFDEKSYREAVAEYTANLTPVSGVNGTTPTTVFAQGILDEMDGENLSSFSTPAVVSTEPGEATVGLSPRIERVDVTSSVPKKSVKKKNAMTLPDSLTADMLPEGCPGWGNYTFDLTTCALCDYNINCMTASDAQPA